MAKPDPIPAAKLTAGNFLAAVGDDDLIHFVLNVGDGDTQLLCLPKGKDGRRRAIVVDVATTKKLPALVLALEAANVLADSPDLFALVVASHPHLDHIGGMAEFLHQFHDHITEFWEPGYYMTSATYVNMMNALEEHGIQVTQPTSGTAKFLGRVRVQALSPSIALRNRFDTYGVEPNNSSITLKVEFPATRITDVPGEERRYVPLRDKTRSLILGADAQTLSWSYVLVDFPQSRVEREPDHEAARDGARRRLAQGRRREDLAPRLQARRQPGVDRAASRRRPASSPRSPASGSTASRTRSRRTASAKGSKRPPPDSPGRRTSSSASSTRAAPTTPAPRSAPSAWSYRRPGSLSRSGGSAIRRAGRST